MLWHRQAIFKSKGDKLCSYAEWRIWTRGPRHQIASRLNPRWQTDWAIQDQVKNLNSTARPYDQRAFSPLDPTVSWLSHLALAIYIFVVVNFDDLAQASDIHTYIHTYIHTCLLLLISMLWYRQVIFESKGDKLSSSAECRIRAQGLRHLFASRLNACWQTDWAIEDQAKTWTRQPVPMISEHSAASTPHSHLALAIYMFAVVNFDALAQASDIRIEMRQVVFLCRIRTHQGLRHQIASRLNARWQTDWAIEDQAKTWTRQPVPMISEHSANSTPQPFGIHTWLWR